MRPIDKGHKDREYKPYNTAKRDFESGQALFNAGAMAKTEFENLKKLTTSLIK